MGLRIISGDLKGRKLCSIPGLHIRPTSDRVRESIFNILSTRVRDAIVLDLFAGTGALGIEALSRGADFAVFVDNHRRAQWAVERNIRILALEKRTRVIRWDAAINLHCLRSHQPPFDLVFMDPPYHQNLISPVTENLLTGNCLAQGAVIVIEHGSRERVPEDSSAVVMTDQRTYGKTLVSILRYML